MGISQPAVSRLIADFQEAVGFKLFRRKRSSAEPTPDALLLFEQVEKLFYGLEELGNQIIAINNMHVGRIAISATSSYASGFLPELIAQFKNMHPNIDVAFYIHSHDQVIDWVSSGRAEIGFAIQPIARSELTTTQLLGRPAQCVFPAGHVLEAKKTLTPADLADLPFVSFTRGTPLRFQIDGVFDRHGIDRQLHVEATSHQAICALVAEGLGVALVTPFAPIDGFRRKLVARPMTPSIMIELQMLYNDAMMSITSRKFVEFVTKAVPKRFARL